MKHKAVPIYLTEEQYSAVRETAVRYGRPMTAVVRDLIQKDLVENSPPPTDLRDLVGTADVGHPTNMTRDHDRLLAEALWDDLRRHRRPLRSPGSERPVSRRRSPSRKPDQG